MSVNQNRLQRQLDQTQLASYKRPFWPYSMAMSLHSAFLHPALLHQATRFLGPWSQPPSRSLQLVSIVSCRCRCTSIWFCTWATDLGATFGDSSGVAIIPGASYLLFPKSGSINLKFSSSKWRSPNLEPPLLVYAVQSGRHYCHLTPPLWKRNDFVRQVHTATVPTRNWKQSPAYPKARPCHFHVLQ